MNSSVCWLFLLFVLVQNTRSDDQQSPTSNEASKAYISYLKNRFEHDFHAKCDKYPLVEHFSNLVEKGSDKQIMFVYQEDKLRNGGLGDRFAGLISAVSIALRTNRTIVFKNQNEVLMKLYRPYQKDDINKPIVDQKYLWSNQYEWSHYNISNANKDETEYDMWNCVNNVGSVSGACSLENVEDVSQPTILYRSNRAYLCRQDINTNTIAHKDFQRLLGANAMNTNLYEVAGCMLRLVLWPTDNLWLEIEDKYARYFNSVGLTDKLTPQRPAISKDNLSKGFTDLIDKLIEKDTDSSTVTPSEHHHNHNPLPVHIVQIAAHFRCGDSGFLHNGQFDENCVHRVEVPTSGKGFGALGTPYHMGLCAKELATKKALHHTSITGAEQQQRMNIRSRIMQDQPVTNPNYNKKPLLPILFVTSDNPLSSEQIMQMAGFNYSFVAPQGCHIELDPSLDCHKFTLTYWTILALSDNIVHQTINENLAAPASAFSRYAGMYSLKDKAFHRATDCSDAFNTDPTIMHHQQGNWFC